MNRTGFELPEENEVDAMALRLLGNDNRLDLDILDEVLGEPRRFRDLKSLVAGKSETPLTRALDRLADAGLIRQGMNLKDPKDPRYYATTRLGVQVAKAIVEHKLVSRLAHGAQAFAA